MLVAKAGADGIRAIGLLAALPATRVGQPPAWLSRSRMATSRAVPSRRSSVETLAQLGVLDDRDLRALAAYHHPTVLSAGR